MLSDRFLGGKFRDGQLGQIAEYAISESDLVTVQEYIREVFSSFEPSSGHTAIPDFKWAGLATTNYDRLIERAYESNNKAFQSPKAFIENGDRVEDHMRDPKGIMLLKLHGCLTVPLQPECPFFGTELRYFS
jgi:hypothetical protein